MKSKHENTKIEFDSSSDGHLKERVTLVKVYQIDTINNK